MINQKADEALKIAKEAKEIAELTLKNPPSKGEPEPRGPQGTNRETRRIKEK
ncbi:hypothetical protein [Candidatus Liberibacter solanacearum]|uniref:hypothetical protein n=1 Tax=Candidatus Liberibacter solanacearum TaxID=556287 RepID=UPI001FDED6D2|nr:hypothetical protein [Candidatus Liberibacter solanacearum]